MKDIIIIGGGPAGLTAAIYAQRAGKSTLIIEEKSYGGQIVSTGQVENYPGFKSISGRELADNMYEQAMSLGSEILYEKVIGISQLDDEIQVSTKASKYLGKAVIIATGAKNRKLGIEGEDRLTGSGVSYCATCDGAFFRNRDVAVIGGGNTALDDAEILSGIAKKVYVIHRRDTFRGNEETARRLMEKSNVEFLLEYVPKEILGNMMVEGLLVSKRDGGEEKKLEVQGIFVAIGQAPDAGAFEGIVNLEDGYVKACEDCKTNAPGIFTAGDCRSKAVRQLSTATADGAVAAINAIEYINHFK